MTASDGPHPPYPLHESVKNKIDPGYAAFYNSHIINNQQVQYQPVEASRTSGILIPGGGPLISVGKTEDFNIKRPEGGPDVTVRCFTPEGQKPANGWPVFLYFHGGGWVLGNINTENTVCTNICARANCVVVSVDYRLAPENPFPAAVNDCWDALLWLVGEGRSILSLDTSKMGIGGSSAGGNLTGVITHKVLAAGKEKEIKFLKQILIVPVMDNTATTENNPTWKENEFTPALPAVKMLWYRQHYLPKQSDWSDPEASPLLYDDDWSKLPPAVIVMGELDVLRHEGEQYGEKLRKAGVRAEVHVFKGMPHPFLAMDGALEQGKQAITYMCDALKVFSE